MVPTHAATFQRQKMNDCMSGMNHTENLPETLKIFLFISDPAKSEHEGHDKN